MDTNPDLVEVWIDASQNVDFHPRCDQANQWEEREGAMRVNGEWVERLLEVRL